MAFISLHRRWVFSPNRPNLGEKETFVLPFLFFYEFLEAKFGKIFVHWIRRDHFNCASETFAHGLPCGKRVRWSSLGATPKQLGAGASLPAPGQRVSIVFQGNGTAMARVPHWDGAQNLLCRLRSLRQRQWLRSWKACSARRADFGVFGHLIPAVANERPNRHASANDEKWDANDCTDYSPAK